MPSRCEPSSLLSRHGFRGVSFACVDAIEDNYMFRNYSLPWRPTTVPFPLQNLSTLLISMDRALSSPNKAVVFVRRNLSLNSRRSHFPAPGLPRARPR